MGEADSAQTSPFMTQMFQQQYAMGAPYLAVQGTYAPFIEAANGKNPTLVNQFLPQNTMIENFQFTPVSNMPTPEQLHELMPFQAIESPSYGSVDMTPLAGTLAAQIQSIPLPTHQRGAPFRGIQSVLNTTNSLNNMPTNIGMGMPNLAETGSLMIQPLTAPLRYAPRASVPIVSNLRAAGINAACQARKRLNAINATSVVANVSCYE